MNITADQVQKLREKTGLGMMLCKKALIEAEGDMEKAIENLRKQGQATLDKRAGKTAKEGCITVVSEGPVTIMYEVNSETDFVARNEDFVAFVKHLGAILLSAKPKTIDEARAIRSDLLGGTTIEGRILELTAKIGEIITFRRFHIETVSPATERVFTYVHNSKIGVLVKLVSSGAALSGEAVSSLGKDIAMQIAASDPMAVSRDNIAAEVVSKEKEIYATQAQSSGKPEKVWDKIVEGKLARFYKDVTLLEQEFIRDTALSVTDRIKLAEKETGTPVTVASFVRFQLGVEA